MTPRTKLLVALAIASPVLAAAVFAVCPGAAAVWLGCVGPLLAACYLGRLCGDFVSPTQTSAAGGAPTARLAPPAAEHVSHL